MRPPHFPFENMLCLEAESHGSGVLGPRSETAQTCFSFILEGVSLMLAAGRGIRLDEPRRARRVPR